MNDLLCSADGDKLALLLLLDLSAAFDTIDHDLLISKLQNEVGVTGKALCWFRSYLCDRSQFVIVGKATSSPSTLLCGVPQGSVLGPILFSLYMKQLGRLIERFLVNRHHFADDSQLYSFFSPDPASLQSVLENLQSCSAEIKQWMLRNKLKLNDDKSEALLCGNARNFSKVSISSVQVGEAEIALSEMVRDLGVIIDCKLSMVHQINSTLKSCFFFIRQLGKLRPSINTDTAKTIAVSLILSRLDYCNALLYGLPDTQLKRLQHVQNVAARIVTRTRKNEHVTPILKDLHWLPVKLRVKHKLLSLTYSCVNKSAPQYLSELVHVKIPVRNLRSSSQLRLEVPGLHDNTNKIRFGARSFKSSAPALWNDLPVALRLSPSAESFKKKLKTYLFSQF